VTPDKSAQFPLVLGLDTFGDTTHDAEDRPISHARTIRDLVEQGVLADELGVDFFGIGEHHTDDWPLSAADVVLGAIAARTNRIQLGSGANLSNGFGQIGVGMQPWPGDPVRHGGGGDPIARFSVTHQGRMLAAVSDVCAIPSWSPTTNPPLGGRCGTCSTRSHAIGPTTQKSAIRRAPQLTQACRQPIQLIGANGLVGCGHSILPFLSDSRPRIAPVRGSVARISMVGPEKSLSIDSGTWVSSPRFKVTSPVRGSNASHSAA